MATTVEKKELQPNVVYVALLGFGSANTELAKLLVKNADRLFTTQQLEIVVTGIFTRSHGGIIDSNGINLERALANTDDLSQATAGLVHDALVSQATKKQRRMEGGTASATESSLASAYASSGPKAGTEEVLAFLSQLHRIRRLNVLAEGIIANYEDAEPAASFARFALSSGISYCTASKAPVALFYHELTELAARNSCKFRFESACGDGVPIFNLVRLCTPGCRVQRFEGIMNTTTNVILEKMELEDLDVDGGIKVAQSLGIAEADPSGDVDGWDAAVKCLCLAQVMLRSGSCSSDDGVTKNGVPKLPYTIDSIPKESLRACVSLEEVKHMRSQGKRIKFICSGEVVDGGKIRLQVRKEVVDASHPFYNINGCDNVWRFWFDNLCSITLIQHDGTVRDTGYGLFADILDCASYRDIP